MTKEEEKLAKAYLTFKQTEEGQLILQDLRNKFFERTFIPNGGVSSTNDFIMQIGMREVIIYILAQTELLEYVRENGNGRST